ncbi:MAG: glycosyltransferase family 2 protein [Bacteroidaceae bacterium]|nr:glycosyltransferase family 2 protein [Bacteroidaceae bacterium]
MIYLVIPCFNEQEVLAETTRQLAAIIDADTRIFYVDDGSRDDTWALIQQLHRDFPQVSGLRLAHNVGHQQALWAGMEVIAPEAEAIISIDADLQDDIAVIPRMIADYRNGADVVYGVRRERKTDSLFKRWTALAFYRLMTAMGGGTVYNHADFRLLSHRALEALLSYPERNLFLRGLVPMIGFRVEHEYYDRKERQAGESKYPFRKMLSFALDGITSFSVKPLRCILLLGFVFLLVALGVIVWALVQHRHGQTIQGWTSLLISVWFVGGSLLLAIGIAGEYIGKIYKEVKRRPRYFVMERL